MTKKMDLDEELFACIYTQMSLQNTFVRISQIICLLVIRITDALWWVSHADNSMDSAFVSFALSASAFHWCLTLCRS